MLLVVVLIIVADGAVYYFRNLFQLVLFLIIPNVIL